MNPEVKPETGEKMKITETQIRKVVRQVISEQAGMPDIASEVSGWFALGTRRGYDPIWMISDTEEELKSDIRYKNAAFARRGEPAASFKKFPPEKKAEFVAACRAVGLNPRV